MSRQIETPEIKIGLFPKGLLYLTKCRLIMQPDERRRKSFVVDLHSLAGRRFNERQDGNETGKNRSVYFKNRIPIKVE